MFLLCYKANILSNGLVGAMEFVERKKETLTFRKYGGDIEFVDRAYTLERPLFGLPLLYSAPVSGFNFITTLLSQSVENFIFFLTC